MGNGRISFPVSEWWWETAVPRSLFPVICSLLANGVGNGRSQLPLSRSEILENPKIVERN
jgi:hypothetical protein